MIAGQWQAFPLAFVCLLWDASCAVYAQPPTARPESLSTEEQIGRLSFSIDDVKAMNRFHGWRDVAIRECRRVLDQRAQGKLDDPAGSQAVTAVRLLASLRVSEPDVTDLLCKNLTLVPEIVRRGHWTDSFVSAMALIEIGGPRAATSIIDHLKHPCSEVELQLCAQILHRNDSHEITFTRFRISTEMAQRELTPQEIEVFVRHLTQIKKWLSDPQFGKDARYTPGLR